MLGVDISNSGLNDWVYGVNRPTPNTNGANESTAITDNTTLLMLSNNCFYDSKLLKIIQS